MKKTIVSFATLLTLAATSIYAANSDTCQNMTPCPNPNGMTEAPAPHMMHAHKGGMIGGFPMLDKLNLSDDQRHKLDVLQSEFKLEMTKLRDPKMVTKMQDLMSADSFNKKEFIKLHNEMHEKMVNIQADHMEKVFNVLTKEQRAELKTLLSQKPKKPAAAPASAPAPTTPAQ